MAYLILEPKELRAAGYDIEEGVGEDAGRYRWVHGDDTGPWRTNRSAAWRKASEDRLFQFGLTWRDSAKLRLPEGATLETGCLLLRFGVEIADRSLPDSKRGFRRVDPNET
jgi:hypothetical protein